MRLRPFALSCALTGLFALLPALTAVTQAKVPETPVSCGQKGRVVFDKDALLTDAIGRRVARFSGGESAVTFISPPADGSAQARIETGTGQGSFRISGFVKASELRLYTNISVPIVSGHVWLRPGTRVLAAGSSAGKVKIEKQSSAPFNQRLHALIDCSALTFTPPPSAFTPPGDARVYLMKISLLDLYDAPAPQGRVVFTLQRAPHSDNVRFFGTEQRGGFVHVQYGSEVGVDAWARANDLQALPRGETSDVPAATYTMTSPPQLQVQTAPRIVRIKRELPLRIAARDTDAPIGVIEPDTDIYVIDTVAGWANVLPQSLHILPVDNLSFWVKAADLGL
jgi:hypothetical protein